LHNDPIQSATKITSFAGGHDKNRLTQKYNLLHHFTSAEVALERYKKSELMLMRRATASV